jgi:hypothetical protein
MALPERGAGIAILTNSDQGAHIGAEVLSAWGHWLGVGAPAKCKVYQGVRSGALGLTVLLGLGLMFKIMGLSKKCVMVAGSGYGGSLSSATSGAM